MFGEDVMGCAFEAEDAQRINKVPERGRIVGMRFGEPQDRIVLIARRRFSPYQHGVGCLCS
jgi:hypothetical protein